MSKERGYQPPDWRLDSYPLIVGCVECKTFKVNSRIVLLMFDPSVLLVKT